MFAEIGKVQCTIDGFDVNMHNEMHCICVMCVCVYLKAIASANCLPLTFSFHRFLVFECPPVKYADCFVSGHRIGMHRSHFVLF